MTEEKRGQMEEGLALQVQEEQALGQVTSQSSPHSASLGDGSHERTCLLEEETEAPSQTAMALAS